MNQPLQEELQFIQQAAAFIKHPNLSLRIFNRLGKPIEALQKRLPDRVNAVVAKATRISLEKALTVAVKTVDLTVTERTFAAANKRARFSSQIHQAANAITGALGGLAGLPGLSVELPLTTALMLRSIARIAVDFGVDMSDPRQRLECLYVFSMGAQAKEGDSNEASYYASRIAFSRLLESAGAYISTMTLSELLVALERGSAPALIRLVAAIAPRFETAVAQKFVVEAVPVIGAAGGAAINAVFTGYFGEAARFHFGLKSLERRYGTDLIQRLFNEL